MEFKEEKFTEIYPDLHDLLELHFKEVEYGKVLERVNIHKDLYEEMEKQKALVIVSAREEKKLLGYASYFIFYSMHDKNILCAENDSYFLHKSARKGFNGLQFLCFAEEKLRERAVQVLTCRVKTKGRNHSALFRRMGYSADEISYCKKL